MFKLFICMSLCLLISSVYANHSSHIVVQNEYFPKPGKEKEVYELRLQATKILAKLGVPTGRVLERMNVGDRPYVMWECDYASIEERGKTVKLVSQSADFKRVETQMGTLINRFERLTWKTE